MNATIVGLIVVPSAIFLLGALVAAIRGIIRFAQYFVRAEESADTVAAKLTMVGDTLKEYIEKTEARVNTIDKRLTVVEYVLSRRREGDYNDIKRDLGT